MAVRIKTDHRGSAMTLSETDHLARRSANHVALSPVSFLHRAALAHPDRPATVYGGQVRSWAEVRNRCLRLASALRRLGIGPGDTVSVMAANTPELFEAHFGVPMTGGVLNALNTRLDAATVRYILEHAAAKVLITDTDFATTVGAALAGMAHPPLVIDIRDPAAPGASLGEMDYEALLASGDAEMVSAGPADEWDSISINYTSGTTGRPKGVVYHHRGAYLAALGNLVEWDMGRAPVYLWTLPMFHCNGWCFPWTVAAKAGTNVCLRRVSGEAVLDAIVRQGVDHFCGAPIVLKMVVDAAASAPPLPRRVKVMTAGAPPPAAVLAAMETRGFAVTHVYGLTETYGPAVACDWREGWDGLPPEERAVKRARQGVTYTLCEEVIVADTATCAPVPDDGDTMGEVLFRGNMVMKGYHDDPPATEAAFAGGWFHSGDLAVRHPDGHIQIRDRLKDIIISGGENISSIEVEDAIHHHPAVAAVAVIGIADDHWGEVPAAYVELSVGAEPPSADDIIAFCRTRLAGFKVPRRVVFTTLPRTSTGKLQKRLLRDLDRSGTR